MITSLTMLLFFRARRVRASSLGLSSTSRITLLFISCLPGIRQSEIEGGSFIHLALCPDTSAMTAHAPLHRGQANAGSFEFVGRMQTLERAKQFFGISHVESRAVVTD